jgi:hypothetical protein
VSELRCYVSSLHWEVWLSIHQVLCTLGLIPSTAKIKENYLESLLERSVVDFWIDFTIETTLLCVLGDSKYTSTQMTPKYIRELGMGRIKQSSEFCTHCGRAEGPLHSAFWCQCLQTMSRSSPHFFKRMLWKFHNSYDFHLGPSFLLTRNTQQNDVPVGSLSAFRH